MPGGADILLACGFREKRFKLTDEERLTRKLVAFYKRFAPDEMPNVDFEKVVGHYVSDQEALWQRLYQKYRHGPGDLRLPELHAEGEMHLILEEPSTTDVDRWSAWYNRISDAKTALEEAC